MQVAQIDVSRSAGLAEMKLAMNRLGVSQRWVGREVGVTGARIAQILDGDSPGGALMFKLAGLLGFDVSLWGEEYDGDVSAIVLDERRGRPRKSTGTAAGESPLGAEEKRTRGQQAAETRAAERPRLHETIKKRTLRAERLRRNSARLRQRPRTTQ